MNGEKAKVDLPLSVYRDPWLAEGVNEAIGFFPREFYILDNYSACRIEYRGFVYGTLEEAYQASSFMGAAEDVVRQIQQAKSPYEAKQISLAHKARKRPGWNTEKVAVMEELLRLKAAQHPYVREMLLKTGDNIIAEDSPKDAFWGWGPDRNGQNMMGKLWMKIREELKEKIQKTERS